MNVCKTPYKHVVEKWSYRDETDFFLTLNSEYILVKSNFSATVTGFQSISVLSFIFPTVNVV